MINEIRDTLTKSLPTPIIGQLRSRGLAIPLDPWMKGSLRFAEKFGAQGSVWFPSICMKTIKGANAGSSTFFVDSVKNGVDLGSIVLINNIRYRVIDFDTSISTDNTLSVDNSIYTSLATGSLITLWAIPITLEGLASKDTTTIRISSSVLLAYMDRLEVPIESPSAGIPGYETTTFHDILQVDLVEQDVEGYKYLLKLKQPLARTLTDSETLYLRAYPAYFSGNIALPLFISNRLTIVGPFLLDYLSGPLVNNIDFEEYSSVKCLRTDETVITPYVSVGSHNIQINRMPIQADQFLFWKLIDGILQWNGYELIGQLDDNGRWRLIESMAPHMEIAGTYAIGSIKCIPTASFTNNEWFIINDGYGEVTFEVKVNSSFIATNGRSTIDLSAVSSETDVAKLICGAVVSAQFGQLNVVKANFANNDTLTVNDSSTSVVFEFKVNSSYSKGSISYITIDLSGAATDNAAAILIASALQYNCPGISSSVIGVTGSIKLINRSVFNVSSSLNASNSTATTITPLTKLKISATTLDEVIQLVHYEEGTIGNNAIDKSGIISSAFVVSGLSGGGGGISWVFKVNSDGYAILYVGLIPNADQTFSLVPGDNTIIVTASPSFDPITHFDLRVKAAESDPATTVIFSSWGLLGSRARMINMTTVIRVNSEKFAASFLLVKPLWPTINLLKLYPDYDIMNGYSLII